MKSIAINRFKLGYSIFINFNKITANNSYSKVSFSTKICKSKLIKGILSIPFLVIVTKKQGIAVKRNLIKRRIRHALDIYANFSDVKVAISSNLAQVESIKLVCYQKSLLSNFSLLQKGLQKDINLILNQLDNAR